MEQSDLYVVDVATGSLRQLTSTPTISEYRPAWSPAGDLIAYEAADDYVHGESAIYLTDVDGADENQATFNVGMERSPAWGPGGERIAFACESPTGWDICILDLATLDRIRLVTESIDLSPSVAWSPSGTQLAVTARGAEDTAPTIHIVTLDSTPPARFVEGADPSWTYP
jgi:TolB protein